MSYCVNCGVELEEYIKKCPLCNTEVVNPNSPYDFTSSPPYPEYHPKAPQKVSARTILTVIAIIFLLPVAICVLADLMTNGTLSWSGYVIASLFCVYTIIASAILAHKDSYILEQLFDYMAIILLIVYIDTQTSGGWFLTFGLPMVGLIAMSTVILTVSYRILNLSALLVTGIAFIIFGFVSIGCDLLINYNFFNTLSVNWSLYCFASLLILGLALIFIDRNKPLKRWIEKKFFI